MPPRQPLLALLAIALLTFTSVVAAHWPPAFDAPAEDTPHEAHKAHGAHGHGAGAHDWAPARGATPTLADATLALERRAQIVIRGDDAFNPANGVRSGTGTFDDPFVISGWFVDVVLIADTTRAFVVKENYVADILVLDWTGPGGHVHHNHLANLRTNRNVERTGDPTAAVIEHNRVERVEELRHFDGMLRNNTIGREGAADLLAPRVALNIAGLNGAGIHDNVIHGGVDMKIHGHHHSDAPDAHSHNHGAPDEAQQEDHFEDHSVRYIDFLFARNRIVDTGFGLRYNDLNHAGDDRQATSEQEPALELPHIHHTRVTIAENVIEGATLRIAVLNSPDERHLPGQSATLVLRANRIVQPSAGDGIVVQDAHDARVHVLDNVVERGELQLAGASAVLLQRFRNVTVLVESNTFGDYRFGVRASDFDANTTWSVGENRGPVDQPVYWDDSVANPPAGAQEPPHAHEGHDGHDDKLARAAGLAKR